MTQQQAYSLQQRHLFSCLALFQITLALALTLGSITPLYALILEWPFNGQKETNQMGNTGCVICCRGSYNFKFMAKVIFEYYRKKALRAIMTLFY